MLAVYFFIGGKKMSKIARKYMAHYINATPSSTATYERIGKDLEEYTIEMNAEVETKKNILGESSTNIGSYSPQASNGTNYADEDTDMFTFLQDAIDNRKTNDDLKTDILDVHLWDETSTTGVFVAYKEDVIVEPKSYGGDTNGYQIPYDVYYCGNRTKGKFTLATKSFVAD